MFVCEREIETVWGSFKSFNIIFLTHPFNSLPSPRSSSPWPAPTASRPPPLWPRSS